MNRLTALVITVLSITGISCQNSNEKYQNHIDILSENSIFPKGEKIENERFQGIAWLQYLVESDSTNHIAVGSVTFEPGARTNWHFHPDGQIILVIEGTGYYQEEGSPKIILQKGNVVTCPPDTPHWHGASSEEAFIQIAITSRLKGPTVWLDPVTDEEYQAGPKSGI